MPHRTGSYFHLHLVSDSTGETLTTVARAATAQYTKVTPVEHVYPLVRTQKQLDRVLAEIEEAPGIVLYTLLEDDLVDAAGEAMPRAEPALPVDPRAGAAAAAVLSRRRDHAIASAPSTRSMPNISSASTRSTTPCCMTTASISTDLEEADVVLVGVSRTSKTPTSIYLANRGVKTGNVPLVPGMPVPPQVEALTQPLVVGLYASPERIVQIRQNRLLGLKAHQRRRPVYRPQGGGRGDRVLAQALRQAQLAARST